jgi:hypothetical protein
MQMWPRALHRQTNSKRRAFRPDLETLEDRTTPTTLLSIAANPNPITDLNAPGTFQLRLVFDGTMNTAIQPAIAFPTPGESPGATLVPGSGSFASTNVANDTFVANYSTTDQNVNIPNIDVHVSGAVDFSGSPVTAQTLNNIFDINTTNPIVIQLNVSDTQITSSDVGSNFLVQITFRDQMQTSINPTITFSQNVSSTLTFVSGVWNANGTVFTATYSIGGTNNVIPSINIAISGAKNLAGFTQLAYSANNVFSINTSANPNTIFPVGSSLRVAGDFNGDNLDDVGAYYPSSGRWLVALSSGTDFLAPIQWFKLGPGTPLKSLLVGDFNNDGKDDIAAFHNPAGGGANWFVASSTGSSFAFTRWANQRAFGVTGWARHLVGDFNGDGIEDVASLQVTTTFARWVVNTSNGVNAFTTKVWINLSPQSITGWVHSVAGDFDDDGKTDIASFLQKGTIRRWWIARSNGTTFTNNLYANMPNFGPWTLPMAGDFNNDDKTDLVMYNSNQKTWYVSLTGNLTGNTFTNWLTLAPAGKIVATVADYTGDGKDDLSILDLGTGQLWVGRSTGTNFAVSSPWDILPATSLSLVNEISGDFNGDGKPDIAHFLTSSATTQWWVSKNNGTTFTTGRWR